MEAIDGGDEAAVAAALAGWSEPQRRAAAPALIAAERETWAAVLDSIDSGTDIQGLQQRRWRIWVALLGCATRSELQKQRVPLRLSAPAVAVLADRRPPWLREWVEAEMAAARDWAVNSAWWSIRELEREELLAPLDTDAAIAGMAMALTDRDGVLAALDADPELIGRVWRLFEVEGGEVGSLARADKYVARERSWRHAILALAADGRLERARLLDASLEALARDFPWFRAQWFTALHEALEPTAEERAARADAYLGLLGSPLEGTIAFAVKAVAKAEPDPAALLAALPGALASERKGTVKAALGLLDRAPGGDEAAVAAAGALQHPAADVQARALDAVERHAGPDPAPPVLAALGRYAEVVAAPVRDRFAGLAGTAAPAPPAASSPAIADSRPAAAERERLVPPADADELAALVTRTLESDLPDPDELDLALDGIARMCGDREPLEGPLAPLVPRARKLRDRGRLIAYVLVAWADGEPFAVEGELGAVERTAWARGVEVSRLAAGARPRALLATPTHRGSFVAAEVLAARLAADREGAGPADAEQARFRLPGDAGPGRPEVEVRMREPDRRTWPVSVSAGAMPDGAIGRAWAHVLEDARPWMFEAGGPAAVRWLRATWPAFSAGLSALGPAAVLLAAADSVTGLSAMLENLLDPDVPLEGPSALLLAAALGAEQDGAGLLATDVAAAALADGRLDGRALGSALRQTVEPGVSAPRRVARRLAALSAAEPGATGSLREALEALPDVAGRDAHHVLELLDDLCARDGASVASAAAREWLAEQRGSSKTAKLARSLLARS
jgi:hypothetical protein